MSADRKQSFHAVHMHEICISTGQQKQMHLGPIIWKICCIAAHETSQQKQHHYQKLHVTDNLYYRTIVSGSIAAYGNNSNQKVIFTAGLLMAKSEPVSLGNKSRSNLSGTMSLYSSFWHTCEVAQPVSLSFLLPDNSFPTTEFILATGFSKNLCS